MTTTIKQGRVTLYLPEDFIALRERVRELELWRRYRFKDWHLVILGSFGGLILTKLFEALS